jgi:hypothetical protein
MSLPHETARSDEALPPTRSAHRADPAPWMAGMTTFAGIMLIIAGVFNVIEGLVALFQNEVYVAGRQYVFAFDLTAWGWTHLIVGAVVAAAGFAVISGQVWGRAVGVGIAVLSMLANFLFIPYYPVWSLLIIALDFFVIWALIAYKQDSSRN